MHIEKDGIKQRKLALIINNNIINIIIIYYYFFYDYAPRDLQ